MADAVVSFALQILRNLLVEETKLLSGVSGEVKALETQLKEMQCLLKDADKRQHQSNIVGNWIAQIRNLTFRAEDVIETYAADEVSSRRRRGFKKLLGRFSCALNHGFRLRWIGLEISDIKSEIARITRSMQEYGIRSIIQGEVSPIVHVDENQARLERLTYPFEIEDCFVGMEDDLRKLVSLIVDDNEHQVISIWGMGGIGKTTIAQKVYNHVDTKRCFISFAWVCITQQCQITSVLLEILKHLNPHQKEVVANRMISIEELIPQLRQVQKEKKCMIVLDDIWTMNQWDCLKHAFLAVGGNSKILLTTRKENIAHVGFSYELGLLNANDGWELLKKKAFPQNTAAADFVVEERLFQKIGKEMVNKCGYLPLAISLLGGILRRKSSSKEWESVNENIDAYLNRGEELHKVHRVLDLSYEDLPSYLKPCFLYMGFLREDENIWVDELYMLWIAQGMISNENQTKPGETLMDLAEFYLSELVSRSIVLVEAENVVRGRRYRSCQLHDMVRDLCLSKGKKDRYSCLKFIPRGILNPSLLGSEARHLAIHFGGEVVEHKIHGEFIATLEESMKHARSLQFLSNGSTIEFQRNIYFQKLKLLRVLRFEKCRFAGRKLPKEIGDLVHLRYLGMLHCELDEIPSSISNLVYLYSFDLSFSMNVRLPNDLNKMLRLKHLLLPLYDYKTQSKNNYHLMRLESLNELETLYGFNSLVHDFKSVSRVKNLQRLQAIAHDNQSLSLIIDAINTTWINMRHCWIEIREGCEFNNTSSEVIFNKVLACHSLTVLLISVPIGKFPKQGRTESIFPNLISLVLQECEIEDNDLIEMLEKLPCLERLRLLERSYMGEMMVFHTMGFPRLKFLVLERLPNLREWRVERGAMPMNTGIELHSCLKLEMVPDGLRFIATLRELVITEMPELEKRVLALDNGGQQGDDFDQVRHVPYVYCH